MILTLASLQTLSIAQTPESFFPSQVGNLWQYYGAVTLWQDWSILRDSVAGDGYRYLSVQRGRTGQPSWLYRLDSTFTVSRNNGPAGWDTVYRLSADSGDAWLVRSGPTGPRYSWVYAVYQDVIFGRAATVKVIRYGPAHPDSGGNSFYFTEQHLASGFGVVYHWEEPGDYAFLTGCIVAGDTFGTIVSVRENESIIPESPQLSQNYPNPFNPTTTIEFSLPAETAVRVSIYDILGREIAILLDEKMAHGEHRIVFDGSHLASGVYFARLRTQNAFLLRIDDFVQIRIPLIHKTHSPYLKKESFYEYLSIFQAILLRLLPSQFRLVVLCRGTD